MRCSYVGIKPKQTNILYLQHKWRHCLSQKEKKDHILQQIQNITQPSSLIQELSAAVADVSTVQSSWSQHVTLPHLSQNRSYVDPLGQACLSTSKLKNYICISANFDRFLWLWQAQMTSKTPTNNWEKMGGVRPLVALQVIFDFTSERQQLRDCFYELPRSVNY